MFFVLHAHSSSSPILSGQSGKVKYHSTNNRLKTIKQRINDHDVLVLGNMSFSLGLEIHVI